MKVKKTKVQGVRLSEEDIAKLVEVGQEFEDFVAMPTDRYQYKSGGGGTRTVKAFDYGTPVKN